MTIMTLRRWGALTLAASLALVARAPDARACAPFHLTTAPIGGQTEVATDGGVIMMQVRDGGRVPGAATLALQLAGVPVDYEALYLAAGLELWRVKASAGDSLTLVGVPGQAAATLPVVAARGRARSPVLRAVRATMRRPPPADQPRMGEPYTTLTIELRRPAPVGAVALIVYRGTGRDAAGLAWAPVAPGEISLELGGGGKGCGGGPPAVFAGDRLSFAWLDGRGRLSARSPARTVALAPAPVLAR